MNKLPMSFAIRAALAVWIALSSAHVYAEPPSRKEFIINEFRFGEAAVMKGDFATARRHFGTVLKKEPEHAYARLYLAKMKLAEKRLTERGPDLKAQLDRIKFDSVDFDDANLSEVVAYVQRRVEETTDGRTQINILVAPGVAEDAKITLSLRNIPATVVLHYAAEMVGVEWHYEKYAVVARPIATDKHKEEADAPLSDTQ